MMKRIAILALILGSISCGQEYSPTIEQTEADSVDWMIANADNYIEDASWRRAELEASLWQPDLPYARKRLAGYSLEAGGWDLLPEFDVQIESVGPNSASFAINPEPPETREEWLALGEEVFWQMPMRRDAYLEWLAKKPELWEEVGLQTDDLGNLRGVVRFVDARGDERLGATCAMCHGDQGIAGAANSDLDLGRGRELFGEAMGIDNSLYGKWGPGTVDVTDDGAADSLAIPDLWDLKSQSHINSSGAIKLASPAALAIRFETQYVVGHSLMQRPKRVLTWALGMYVYSLEAGTRPQREASPVFEAKCAACHKSDEAYGGGLIAAEALNSDPAAAYSPLRGTGFYKVPTLIGMSNARRFMHDGSVDSVEGVLDSGHPFDAELTEDERSELIRFMNTL